MVKKRSFKISNEILKNIIIKRLPKLLEKEPILKDYLANLLEDRFADRKKTEEEIRELLNLIYQQNKKFEEHTKILEEHSKTLREHSEILQEQSRTLREHTKILEEHSKNIEEQNRRIEEQNKRLEEQNKRLEEHSKILQELLLEVKSMKRDYNKTIGALGSRWGLRAEKSFRDAMKGILEEDFKVKVERYMAYDDKGKVFGRPDQIELDLIIQDGKVIVVEIKSSISKGDVYILTKKIQFYKETEQREVNRVIIISPMIESKALEYAKDLGIEVYGEPEEANLVKEE
ncbi:MAG: DUF3782 domain-containing protein [Caldimicrobium sp.]|nr:DUF3782 domain-containing protein [Caldimicrobium sp.]